MLEQAFLMPLLCGPLSFKGLLYGILSLEIRKEAERKMTKQFLNTQIGLT